LRRQLRDLISPEAPAAAPLPSPVRFHAQNEIPIVAVAMWLKR
jgi:hypothetical protein